MGRFWAEETSERELDGEGRSSAGTTMASGGLSSVLGRFGRGRARPRSWRDGRASGRGVVVRSATNRVAAARTCRCDERRRLFGAARSSLARRALRRRKEDWDGTRGFEVVHEVKSGARTRWPTRGSSPPATVAGMASNVTVTSTVETLFTRLNDFSSRLTS